MNFVTGVYRRPHKGENESDTEFSDSGKWMPIWGKMTLSELNIDNVDGDNDSEIDEDHTGDGVQTIDIAKLWFLRQFSKLKLTNF